MPLLLLPLLAILALCAVTILIPLSLVQRYRVGTSRQRARGWLAALNLTGILLSTILFVVSAAMATFWVPGALSHAAGGLAAGAALGILGLWLTRWEPSPGDLHYTPSRPLVLAIMLLVFGRLVYGLWRGWRSWQAGLDGESWLVGAGVPGSIAAGAIVLGYYLVYWYGVRRRYRVTSQR